jgi:hypothetical protein
MNSTTSDEDDDDSTTSDEDGDDTLFRYSLVIVQTFNLPVVAVISIISVVHGTETCMYFLYLIVIARKAKVLFASKDCCTRLIPY